MLDTDVPIVTDVKSKHERNAATPRVVTELGMVTDVKPVPWKACCPMLVKEFGRSIDVRCQQSWKVHSPIVVTEFGMVTVERFEHPLKAPLMVVTEFGIVTDVKLVQKPKTL